VKLPRLRLVASVLDAFRELIDELISAPKALRDAGIDTTDNREVINDLAFIAVRDLAVHKRIQEMVAKSTPLLPAPPDAPPASITTAVETIDLFDSGRGELVSLLMNLTLKDWERTGIDHTGHEISVADDVESHVEFDEVHVARITDLLERA
jgi:hypothetical protein